MPSRAKFRKSSFTSVFFPPRGSWHDSRNQLGGLGLLAKGQSQGIQSEEVLCLPSKMRTAVAKSLTRRAALRAAAMTTGEGTRS